MKVAAPGLDSARSRSLLKVFVPGCSLLYKCQPFLLPLGLVLVQSWKLEVVVVLAKVGCV